MAKFISTDVGPYEANADDIIACIQEAYPGDPIGTVTERDTLIELDLPNRTQEEVDAVIVTLKARFPLLVIVGAVE